MESHDPLCPGGPLISGGGRGPYCRTCPLIAKVRADERERFKALGRMLLDSGDITPMGVRMINKIVGDRDE